MKTMILLFLLSLGVQTATAACEGFCGEEYKMKLMEEIYETATEPTVDQLIGTWMYAEGITQYTEYQVSGREFSSDDSDAANSKYWQLHFSRKGKVDFYTGEQAVSVKGFYTYSAYSGDKNDSAKVNFDGKSACFFNKLDLNYSLGKIHEDIRTCRAISFDRIICKSVRITNGTISSIGYVGWIKN